MTSAYEPLRAALDRAGGAGRTIRIWLRDDDCVAPTPALERLAGLCDAVSLPVLLAVIPESAQSGLGAWIAAHPGFAPCQHGFAHADHAPAGARPIELGGARPTAEILDELARGRSKLQAVFGAALSDILVPPWNRIDPALVPHLAALGFSALSTIAPSSRSSAIPRLDCDLDIMDWRHGRVGRALADVARAAATVIDRKNSLGLLTHHLAHDEGGWAVLGELIEGFATHPVARFAGAEALIASG